MTAQATALNNLGVLNSASWIDIDRDGLIELFVTRHDATNLRFELTPGTYFGFTSLDAGFAATGSNTEGAAMGRPEQRRLARSADRLVPAGGRFECASGDERPRQSGLSDGRGLPLVRGDAARDGPTSNTPTSTATG